MDLRCNRGDSDELEEVCGWDKWIHGGSNHLLQISGESVGFLVVKSGGVSLRKGTATRWGGLGCSSEEGCDRRGGVDGCSEGFTFTWRLSWWWLKWAKVVYTTTFKVRSESIIIYPWVENRFFSKKSSWSVRYACVLFLLWGASVNSGTHGWFLVEVWRSVERERRQRRSFKKKNFSSFVFSSFYPFLLVSISFECCKWIY